MAIKILPPAIAVLISAGLIAKKHRSSVRPPPSAAAAEGRGATQIAHARAATPEKHFQNGEDALLNRNFPKAAEQFQLALDRKEDLDDRQRALSHLGLAIAMNRRFARSSAAGPAIPISNGFVQNFEKVGGRGGDFHVIPRCRHKL